MFKTFFSLFACLLYFGLVAQKIDSIPNGKFVQFEYPNGKISSEGFLLKGKPEGYWKNYYSNGNIKSEGLRENYKLEGNWKFYDENSVIQKEIIYSAEKKFGIQKTYSTEGFLLRKEPYLKDTLHGSVLSFYPDGRISKKTPFEKGKKEGVSTQYDETGAIVALIEYKNDIIYNRQYINKKDKKGLKQGPWKDFYPNEQIKNEGNYFNNLKDGYWKSFDEKGLLISTVKYDSGKLSKNAAEVDFLDIRKTFHKDGKVATICNYNGQGKREGICREYDTTGAVTSAAVYRNGKLLGTGMADKDGIKTDHWKEYYNDGVLRAEGDYQQGEKFGEWVFYYREGQVEQKGSFTKGELYDGIWTWFHKNGNTWRSEVYYYGLENGPFVEYSDSNTVISEGDFIEGLEDGPWLYQLNDHKEVGAYSNGQREGEWLHYYFDETVRFKGKYDSGLPEGRHTFYYDTGKKMLEGKYEFGLKNNTWTRYNRDGTILVKILFRDGKEIKIDGAKVKPTID
ncbi:MAG: hypothetical protein OSB25_03225 [Salibacteraceae bacterium]|nr:hypothetical protein [Salibacteraceae bacterium]